MPGPLASATPVTVGFWLSAISVVVEMPGPLMGAFLFVMLWGDFIYARSNALATGVTCSVHMPLSYWPSWAYLGWRSSHAIYLIFTRRSIDLGMNDSAEGCVGGIGSGVHETRPGWMTGCE